MLKKALLITLSLSLNVALAESGSAKERRRFNVFGDLTYNSNSIKTKETTSTLSATTTSTFTAAEFGADYFIHPRFAVTAQMLFTLTTSIDAEINGYDVGMRWYPFNKGYQTDVELLGSKIESTPGIASFFYGGFSNRDYQFGNSNISFQGIEAGAGVDYHFQHHYFIRGSLNYQMLSNTSSRTLSGFAAGFGIGYSF